MGKGPNFEREIPKEFSLWFTGGERDDIFWRTQGSGGRAKNRSKKGLSTYGSYGDLMAVDPIGEPLTQACLIELKRGYKKWSFLDLVDRPRQRKNQKNPTLQPFEEFMVKVNEDLDLSGASYPIIIFKRDKRQKGVVIPQSLFSQIQLSCGRFDGFFLKISTAKPIIREQMYILKLEDFFNWCSPSFFIELSQSAEEEENASN
jgi:hypothetical protein